MTHAELEKIFGEKLETIELKPPKFDIPEEFNNVAVYVSRSLDSVIRREAKILPAKEVKCHGVIPMSKEYKEKYDKLPPHERPFNCCIGDYTEERHTIWIRGLELKPLEIGEEYKFKATHSWGMPDGHATASCSKDDVNTWLPIYYADESHPAGYVGFFVNNDLAREAVRAKFIARREELDKKRHQFYDYMNVAEKIFED